MSAETPVQSVGAFTRLRLRFRAWRGGRPFWAGLFTLLGGVPIAYFPYATLKLGTMSIAMSTTAGAGSLIIGVLLFTLGLTMWFQQATRVFAGVASILLALVSLVVSNIGGFIMGFLLALIGGALALSWMPGRPADPAAGGGEPGSGDPAEDSAPDYGSDLPEVPQQPYGTPGAGAFGSADGARAEDPKGVHHVG
ncbi:DUF6114 domain-containing protein [Streptomyces sp. ST1015]|uniref:DUF6114 domain-containing protein n=1 Tax=Streptomyces niveiscabiei TaxID=164115 RepID=A0ABW9HNS1_9ACTN|nr:DUF6114 domain-containing protein [Streptomyces sp. ST1015]QZZ30283.1 hypothetical protein A7X85_32195 [Streptomyces sp. ST1015]